MGFRVNSPVTIPPNLWEPHDLGLLTWSYPPEMGSLSTAINPAGTLWVSKLHMPSPALVSNIWIRLSTSGSVLTAGQCFAGLFKADTRALLGVTADQSTPWMAASALLTMALVTPVTVPVGDVFVGVFANGTTMPSFSAANSPAVMVNANLATANSRGGLSSAGLTTAMPNPMAVIASANLLIWCALN